MAVLWTAALWIAASRGRLSQLAVHLGSGCQGDNEMEGHEAADHLPQMMGLADRQAVKKTTCLRSVSDHDKHNRQKHMRAEIYRPIHT